MEPTGKPTASIVQPPLSHVLLVVVALTAAYHETFTWIVKTWFTFTSAHGPVILAISVFMVWKSREELRKLSAEPALVIGMTVTALGLLMLLSGTVGGVLLLQYLSVIVTLLGLILLVGGYAALSLLWSPICYLVFMFPVFNEVLDGISIYFQLTAAWIAHNLLQLVGIPSIRTAQFLELPSNSLEVARECNGINHMMALVSLAVLLAWWTQNSWKKRAILIASAFPVAIIVNGLRVFCIGVLSEINKGGPLHGPFDMFYVSFIFFFGTVLLAGINSLLGRDHLHEDKKQDATDIQRSGQTPASKTRLATALAVCLLSLSAAHLAFVKPLPVSLKAPLESLPRILGEWHGRDATFDELPYRYFSADIELKRIYQDKAGNEIKLYIGYFPVQSQDREVVNYRFDALQLGAEEGEMQAGGRRFKVNKVVLRGGERVYSWYDVNGKVLTSRYLSKIASIQDGLTERRTNAAVIALGVRPSGTDRSDVVARDFLEVLEPVLEQLLPRP